jgi:hypothetical protein
MSRQMPDIGRHLRAELLRRVEAHPVRTWSPHLLTAMIAIFDLYEQSEGSHFKRDPSIPATGKSQLRIVDLPSWAVDK